MPFRRLHLRHHTRKPVFRMIVGYTFDKGDVTDEVFTICEADGRTYTPAFRSLLHEFT